MKRTRVATLSATNLKGSTFSHQLAPVTVFTGVRGAGKTTRLDALRLALLGYLPGVASKQSDLHARAASGTTMDVCVEFDNPQFNGGSPTVRRWRESRGSIKYEGNGCALDFPAMALDPGQFLDLTGPQQVAFLLAATTEGPFLPAAVRTSLAAAVAAMELECDPEHRAPTLNELGLMVVNYSPEGWDGRVQSLLAGLQAEAADQKKLATANAVRLRKTLEGLAQVGGIPPNPDAAAEAEALAGQLMDAERALAAKEQAGRTAASALEATKRIAAGAADEAALRAELVTLEAGKAKAAEACLVVPDVDSAVNAHHAAWQERLAAQQACDQYNRAINDAQDALEKARGETSCPHCGQSVVELRKDIVAKLAAEVERLTSAPDPSPRLEVASKALHEATKAKDEAAAARRDYDRAQREFRELSTRHAAIVAKLNNLSAARDAQAALPGLEQQLVALRGEFAALRTHADEVRAKHAAAVEEAKQLAAHRAHEMQKATVAEQLARMEAEEKGYAGLVAITKEKVAEVVQSAVGSLLRSADELFAPVAGYSLAYQDGEFGVRPQGRFWSYRTFSGTERALFECSLCYALAQHAPIRIVLLDELGRIDKQNRTRLLSQLLCMAAEGKIDQALLTTTDLDGVSVEGELFQEIKVTK